MKTQVTLEEKLADWESVFYSIGDLQNDEALKGLISGLRVKIGVITPGVA
jgi:hypothetical protein